MAGPIKTLTTYVVKHVAGLAVAAVTYVAVHATDASLVDAVFALLQRVITAFTQSLSGAVLIVRGIFSNATNPMYLTFVLNNLYDLVDFVYDLARPKNVVEIRGAVMYKSDGSGNGNDSAAGGIYKYKSFNPYSEVDLSKAENRQALVYQMQRIMLSVIQIVKLGRAREPLDELLCMAGDEQSMPTGLENLEINTVLRSDFNSKGNPPPQTYVSKLPKLRSDKGNQKRNDNDEDDDDENTLLYPPPLFTPSTATQPPPPPPADSPTRAERWLFINGIANELVWFQRSCDKIRDTFHREVTGVYNRSDGILWDFIECFGEHSAAVPMLSPPSSPTTTVTFDATKDKKNKNGNEEAVLMVKQTEEGEAANDLIQRTPSSRASQAALEKVLKETLWPRETIHLKVNGSDKDGNGNGNGDSNNNNSKRHDKVVIIAHSQGCMILRLALQNLVREFREGSQERLDMRRRLCVFTFANPSIDWWVLDKPLATSRAKTNNSEGDNSGKGDNRPGLIGNITVTNTSTDADSNENLGRPLTEFALMTEHFAHEADFVARIGIQMHMQVKTIRRGYDDADVYWSDATSIDNPARGHLFGAHYSLEPDAYQQGEHSRLLKAIGGVPLTLHDEHDVLEVEG